MAEWSTAGDDLVCPLCEPLEGIVMSIKDARDMLPRHTNCRCMWIPAEPKKVYGTKASAAIDESVLAEGGKNTKKRTRAQIKRRSSWPG